jgi:hypothetical protein
MDFLLFCKFPKGDGKLGLLSFAILLVMADSHHFLRRPLQVLDNNILKRKFGSFS